MIGTINDLQRQIIDQETGVRGFLLTSDRAFLEPFERAHPIEALDSLVVLMADNPAQQARLREVRARYAAWMELTLGVVQPGAALDPFRGEASLLERKARMDAVRVAVSDLGGTEEALRRARAQESSAANHATFVGGGVLFVAMAAALALLSRRQLGEVAATYNGVLTSERATRQRIELDAWVRDHHLTLTERTRGDKSLGEIGDAALAELVRSVDGVVGAFYVVGDGGWERRAGHALDPSAPERFRDGEGLVGQAGREQRPTHITAAPSGSLRVRSGSTDRSAVALVLVPARVDGEAFAVVEIGFLKPVAPRALELLDRVGDAVGVAVRSAIYRARLRELLEESQRQAEELQAQQEELRVTNEELHQQSDLLRGAQAELEERKEELEASNADLGAQRDALQRTQKELAEKAVILARSSQYKSEFLANMSHELRTPLNSTLILAKLLADNRDENLTAEQVKFAETIYSAGNDLLTLINDILDLSKIEAGKIDLHVEQVTLARLVDPVTRMFEPVARDKGLTFAIQVDGEATMVTDTPRVQQILKNLLSNAFKFTEAGSVRLRVARVGGKVEMAVRDTGIGIAPHQQEIVFEAFRQADGTTNRKFGGTGLGLSISRDLARHLGGELRVESATGQGSTFTLTLPVDHGQPAAAPSPPSPPPPLRPRAAAARPKAADARSAQDDRDALEPHRRLLLIVEDDVPFTEILGSLARQHEFQCLVAHDANDGVRLALEHRPSAILLDINLPDHSGLSALDRLKRNPATRHIPIHVISAADHAAAALSMGAAGYLMKPVSSAELVEVLRKLRQQPERMRRLLIVEDDAVQRDAVRQLLEAGDVEIVSVETVAEALEQLGASTFDCVVTDLALGGASGYDLLERMAADERYSYPPVIVYTGRALSPEEEQRLRRYSSSIIVKGARSPERLLDEVTLFLHQVEAELPPDRQRMLRQVRDREAAFADKKILVAEDDVRNIFALTSLLEPRGAKLILARNGREALDALDAHPDVDLILMDIMMPEMDGLEAMAQIRGRGGRFATLPIIALTAKAMRDDQERCLAAGANDYLAKPLDVDVLVSLIRVWMPK